MFSFTQIRVMQKWVHPTESLWSKAKFRLQMSNLTRIQPQIIHYTGVQQTVDYKTVLLKENPFPFHAVSNGTTWKRNVTRPEKENNFFTQERWRLQEDQQSFTYQSEYCSKSGTNILQRWNCNHLTETSRSSTEVNTSTGASSDEKGWRKSTCKFTAVI